jgi:hypothetical protein
VSQAESRYAKESCLRKALLHADLPNLSYRHRTGFGYIAAMNLGSQMSKQPSQNDSFETTDKHRWTRTTDGEPHRWPPVQSSQSGESADFAQFPFLSVSIRVHPWLAPFLIAWSRLKGLAVFGFLLAIVSSGHAADSLNWRKDKDAVDADINSWTLVRTLESISEATGWQIYVEPGTQKKVSTKFKDRPRDRALDLLLGNLGRVLLPGTNGGPSRLLVFRNTQKDATQLVRKIRKGKAIPNELIVRMKKGESVDDLAKKMGAKVLGRSEELNSGRLQFESEDAANSARETLLGDEDVASVDPNFPVIAEPTLDPYGGAAPRSLNLQPLKEGDPLIIGLVDTAVQKLGNNYDNFLLPGISVAGEATLPTDHPTHGTSMFETILNSIDAFTPDGGSSPVRILSVDIYGSSGQATTYEVGEGILQALKGGARIINLSLGSEGDSDYLHYIIQEGVKAGAEFVVSAGNTPTTEPTYPAGYPEVNSITAGDSPNSIAPYANYGDSVDAMAPGTSRINFNGRTYIVNGTSPAAAYFSGAVAVAVAGGQSAAEAVAAVRKAFPVPAVRR